MRMSDWSSDVCSSDLWMVGVGIAAVVPRVAGVPDDAAGLLKPAIRIDELGADHADAIKMLECPQPFVQPVPGKFRIVVEHHDVFARSEKRRVGKEGVSTCRYRW